MKMNDHEYLTTKEAARVVNMHPDTVKKLRTKGGGPTFCKVKNWQIRYRKDELIQWLESKKATALCQL